MVETVSYDTTFLIDPQREKRQGVQGRAHEFLRAHSSAVGFLNVILLGEFMESLPDTADPRLRRLRASGHLTSCNDLWIGSCSVRHRGPLVTRNTAAFSRIGGLQVFAY
jgi:hypothetical protein